MSIAPITSPSADCTSTRPGTGTSAPPMAPATAPMKYGCCSARAISPREPIPSASAPLALPTRSRTGRWRRRPRARRLGPAHRRLHDDRQRLQAPSCSGVARLGDQLAWQFKFYSRSSSQRLVAGIVAVQDRLCIARFGRAVEDQRPSSCLGVLDPRLFRHTARSGVASGRQRGLRPRDQYLNA